MSKLAHSSDEATMHKIERDARAREGAESAAMAEAERRDILDLADESITRQKYEWFCRQPNAPRITFKQYALAYGEKKPATDDELRAAYDRLCADLKSAFPGIQSEYFAPPSFVEFKQAYLEDIAHA